VLAHDAVDRAALDLEVDITIGPDGAEALVDLAELDSPIGVSGPGGPLRVVCCHVIGAHAALIGIDHCASTGSAAKTCRRSGALIVRLEQVHLDRTVDDTLGCRINRS